MAFNTQRRDIKVILTLIYSIPQHPLPQLTCCSFLFCLLLLFSLSTLPFNLLSFQDFSPPSISIYPPLSIHFSCTLNRLLTTHNSPLRSAFLLGILFIWISISSNHPCPPFPGPQLHICLPQTADSLGQGLPSSPL